MPIPQRPAWPADPGVSNASRARPRALEHVEPGETPRGGGKARAVVALSWAAWRYRRQIALPALLLGLVTVAGLGHLTRPDAAWLPLPAGAATAGLLVLLNHRPVQRWYALGVGAAGLWAAAAWWVGLADPVVLLALLALTTGGGLVWRSRLPRPRVAVYGGSHLPWQWEAWRFRQEHGSNLRRVVRDWPLIATRAKVAGATIRTATTDVEGDEYELLIDLHGLALDDLRRALNRIASGLRARRMTTQVLPDEEYEHLVRITWARPDAALERWQGDSEPEAEPELADAEPPPPPETRPASVDRDAIRLERLVAAVELAGPRVVSGRELADLAGLPTATVARHLPRLATTLGLRQVEGGWQRLSIDRTG